jgi:hypothetical protein
LYEIRRKAQEFTPLDMADIEVGKRYLHRRNGEQYYATVIKKGSAQVCAILGDVFDEKTGGPGDPTKALGTLGDTWVDSTPSKRCEADGCGPGYGSCAGQFFFFR